VFDDRDPGAEQDGMHWAIPVISAVDVEGIDADQRRATGDECLRERRGEMRMVFEIFICAPAGVPAGVKEHRRAANRRVLRESGDRAIVAPRRTDDHARKIG
jgi:hypothetical protein